MLQAKTISDMLSHANTIYSHIYLEQWWELYDDFSISGCLAQSSIIRSDGPAHDNIKCTPFRDMSYNFLNSFNDVKKASVNNCSHILRKSGTKFQTTSIASISVPLDQHYHLATLFGKHLKVLYTYFNENKKGKNTTKQEKLYLCNNISDTTVQFSLDEIISKIIYYNLFELTLTDNCGGYSTLIHNKTMYLKEPETYYNIIDIRIFKRFLNIFTINTQNNTSPATYLKPHVEMSIRYKILLELLDRLVRDKLSHIDSKNEHGFSTDIESMTTDLSNIWKLT